MKQFFFGGSLRRRLVFIIAAALTPILLIAGVQAYIDAQDSMKERRLALLQIADRAIDDVEQSLSTAEILLEVFSAQIAAGRCTDVEGWLKEKVPALSTVVFFDADGISQCASQGEAGFPIVDMEWNERLKAGEKIIRTDAFYGKGLKEWMFAILARLEVNGDYKGAASFGMRADKLSEIINPASLPDDVAIALSDDNDRLFGKLPFSKIEHKWIEDAREADGGFLIVEDSREGDAHDVVINRIGTTGVYAIVTRPSPGLLDEITLRPAKVVGLPLLTFSIALFVAWLAIDNLVLKWLARLSRLASAYGKGDYTIHPGRVFKNAPEEILKFAKNLDRMSDNINIRDKELVAAIAVKDAAVKEIHHRVKNNLQIVTSFLNLQSRRLKNTEGKNALAAARHRINALAVVHQTLYQHERLEIVHMRPFLEGLIQHLSGAMGMEDLDIEIITDIDDLHRASDDAIPLALFIVEVITNSVKYAFDDQGGKIALSMKQVDQVIELTIRDDGVGSSYEEPEDDADILSNGTGLGSQLMNAFARQLKGTLEVIDTSTSGYTVKLLIPHTDDDQPESAPTQ
ncbi:sensor histidine kinase [Hirschia litorea]|uniref:histidine kinase n=1 Tax=Hirschia litorea TaxID=1199156 RepID=A0ABW2IP16_9PROT